MAEGRCPPNDNISSSWWSLAKSKEYMTMGQGAVDWVGKKRGMSLKGFPRRRQVNLESRGAGEKTRTYLRA